MGKIDEEREAPYRFSVRTDLALEAREILDDESEEQIKEYDGIEIFEENFYNRQIKVTWVEVFNENGAKALGKPLGNYITIESKAMKENDVDAHEEIVKVMAKKLQKLRKLKKNAVVLIVGLGNWNVTPDALGPKVVSKVLVTRHLSEHLPEELKGLMRSVSAISPGVMGLTGIETSEIIRGVVEKINPDLVIAIDALAARRTSRINATIQIADTGVSPGAGMGNKRVALNEKTLGVPIIAIGVPTVVDAATLVNDTMDRMLESMSKQAPQGSEFFEMLMSLADEEKYHLITEILNPYTGNMFVTPKEVDAVVERLSAIIANAINVALHPGIKKDDFSKYLNA
ncbi:MAG: GPR endopeptidase [Clostridiales bacterium]|jgi:spore protease|nr:GPR endopeptidase [Clostridiales bacterium]